MTHQNTSHDCNVFTNQLLYRDVIARRQDLKLIVTSATINYGVTFTSVVPAVKQAIQLVFLLLIVLNQCGKCCRS